jgi:nitroimidazol reductase NimA-like FMN-containing flavoprotein (pyridoxamine 5'-phosphate oxidase superfamily)
MEAMVEILGEEESLRLIERVEVGRIGFSGRYGPEVLPVNFKVVDGTIVFRTEADGALGEDLRTGIRGAEYKVAFEVDEVDAATRTGWSVMVQGAVHHVEDEAERAELVKIGIESWMSDERSLFMRITPRLITGRRINQR